MYKAHKKKPHLSEREIGFYLFAFHLQLKVVVDGRGIGRVSNLNLKINEKIGYSFWFLSQLVGIKGSRIRGFNSPPAERVCFLLGAHPKRGACALKRGGGQVFI